MDTDQDKAKPRRSRVRVDSPQLTLTGTHKGKPRSLNLSLLPDVIRDIKALALLRSVTVSDLVAEWAREKCRGLCLYQRGGEGEPSTDTPPVPPSSELP